jgi:HD-like signal output (HDOD) protein
VATYQVSAECNACGELHTTGIVITLNGGPVNKQHLAEAFPKRDRPANVNDVRVYCHKVGRHYAQNDPKKIFLIPVR